MTTNRVPNDKLYRPSVGFDLLRVPGLGRLLRWRWGRLALQLPMLALALVVVYDGLTGAPLASHNIATVSVWVHYRGLVMLALLLVGNLFCMACPFTLPRTLAQRLSSRGRRWPRALRNKWLAVGVFVVYLWLYEALDLWASPALTAWLVIGYFGVAFVLEALFAESPFCKYVCPLGTFNFLASSISPLQITARSAEVCRTCVGKECINGSPQTLGCGLELFVPQIKRNLDCTFCLDCARACPHDNVALAARQPLREFTPIPLVLGPAGATVSPWPRRWDTAFLALVFAFAGLTNAFGMTPPVYALAAALSRALGARSEALISGADLRRVHAAAARGAGPGRGLAQPAGGHWSTPTPGKQPAGMVRPLRADRSAAGLCHLVRALLVPLCQRRADHRAGGAGFSDRPRCSHLGPSTQLDARADHVGRCSVPADAGRAGHRLSGQPLRTEPDSGG